MLEEQLQRILDIFLFHPQHLEEARLSFAQKVALARSMSLDEHSNSMWQLNLAVNTLRNELAHALGSEKRKNKFDRLKTLYIAERDVTAEEADRSPDHIIASFAISLCLGFLGSFEEEVTRFKSWINNLDHVVNPHRHQTGKGGD